MEEFLLVTNDLYRHHLFVLVVETFQHLAEAARPQLSNNLIPTSNQIPWMYLVISLLIVIPIIIAQQGVIQQRLYDRLVIRLGGLLPVLD